MWYEAGDEVLVRYLLGELETVARGRFEDEYFGDDALHERLLAIECDLVDAYVQRVLSPAEDRDFERRYLATSGGRKLVERARLLGAYSERTVRHAVPTFASQPNDRLQPTLPVAALVGSSALVIPLQTPEPNARRETTARNSWWDGFTRRLELRRAAFGWALVPAATIIVVLSLIVIVRPWRRPMGGPALSADSKTRTQPGSQSPISRGKPDTGDVPKTVQQPGHMDPPTLFATLTPIERGDVGGRGGAGRTAELQERSFALDDTSDSTLRLNGAIDQVTLRIVLRGKRFSSYIARLQTAEGKDSLSRDHLHDVVGGDGLRLIELTFPSSLLAPGDYKLQLRGLDEVGRNEDAGEYSFRCVLDHKGAGQ